MSSISFPNGSFAINYQGFVRNLFLGKDPVTAVLAFQFNQTLTQGNGSGQYQQTASIDQDASTTPTEFNLQDMVNANPYTSPISFNNVVGFLIQNKDAINSIILAPGGSNGWFGPWAGTGPTYTLGPGDVGAFFTATGWPVSSGAKNFTVTASAATPEYAIEIFGN
jgi:hypothetical protein